uniref:Glycosyltransferase 2-like domain-containing protein n=1 Tax=Acrobeloides nanus TaxID=290746 RepID=A0A914BXT6_9BILA
MERWHNFDYKSCEVKHHLSTSQPEADRYDFGQKNYMFNVLVSDKLGPRRDVPNVAHEKCSSLPYAIKSTASIVIVYHNEAFSTLVRTINSVFDRTPKEYLHEIILYDDFSEDHLQVEQDLQKYAVLAGWDKSKLHWLKAEKREGLMRAKVYAARNATGDVLVFLDSHVEVNVGWIEPLLNAIQEDPRRIVQPVIDLIKSDNFQYTQVMISKGGFDVSLRFQWEYFDWTYFNTEENNLKVFETPSLTGSNFAVQKKFFHEIGEFDLGMDIWGSENIEVSLRLWLCANGVFIAPCSHVGHVFRTYRPYKTRSDVDTLIHNAARTAKVWLNDKYLKHFFDYNGRAAKVDAGDLTERFELRNRLKCKPLEWFIENVYPTFKPPRDEL